MVTKVMLKNIDRNGKADEQVPQIIENIQTLADAVNRQGLILSNMDLMVKELDIRIRSMSKYLQ